jgi:hypothetical protein
MVDLLSATMPFLSLALVVAITGLAASAPPIPVALAPISAEALHQCKGADLEKTLKAALGRAKRLRLVAESEDAPTRMEILECSEREERKQTFSSKSGPGKGPVGGVAGIGGDSEISLQNDSVLSVILRARLVAGPRFVNVTSGPKDRTLREAAKSLQHAIDKALTDRGPWLLASPP